MIALLLGLGLVPAYLYFDQPSVPTWQLDTAAPAKRAPGGTGPQLQDGYSNIHRDDYVGPAVCGECHEKQYARWAEHPHSRMNLNASATTVQGDFADRHLSYAGMEVDFHRDGDGYAIRLRSDDAGRRRSYRVTRTVGSRFTQMYIGVQTSGPEPAGDPVYQIERKLPFGFWTSRDRWLPATYFDSDYGPDYPDGGDTADTHRLFRPNLWESNCIYCHNTYAYSARIESQLPHMTGFPREDLSLQPQPGRRRSLPVDDLVTLGISCESCHFGGRAHARDEQPIRFIPSAPGLTFARASGALVEGARDSPYVINSICAQCHAARGVSLYPNGAGTWNAREALDQFAGSCGDAIKCTDCHDPHTAGPPGGGPDDPKHIAACTGCHDAMAQPATAAAHSRHDPSVTCLDCHMPRITQGLDVVVRSHRISSPTDPAMLRQASPNACNLCHLDRPITWTLDALASKWSATITPEPQWQSAHGGDLDTPLGEVWLGHEIPIARLVARAAYARTPVASAAGDAVARLLPGLNDTTPVNRMFALFALEKTIGRRITEDEYQPTAPPGVRRQQVEKLAQDMR